MVSQRDWAAPPAFEPLPYRLVDAAEPATFTGHQKLGVMFTPDFCGPMLNMNAVCVTGGPQLTTLPGGIPSRATDPFLVYSWLPCDVIGEGYDEMERRTREALVRNGPTTVEQVFWTGGTSNGVVSPHLAANAVISEVVGGSTTYLQTAATVITGTFTPTNAIARLESVMAGCYGGRPFIHVPRIVTPYLSERMIVKASGNRLVTDNGSVVVPGAGYTGTGPDGSAATNGNVWIYATGKVKAWSSPIDFTENSVAESIYRPTNTSVIIAKQWWMLGWDCCHFALQMSLTALG